MFQKINELLAFFGHDGATFALIRNMLREKLIPLGFREDKIKGLGYGVKYIRDSFLVELYFDYREKEYSFFASSDVQDLIRPPRQISIEFPSAEYTSEKKQAIDNALREWLKTISLK